LEIHVDAQQTKSALVVLGNNQAATTLTPPSLTFAMERAGLPNASALASNKLANPGCGAALEAAKSQAIKVAFGDIQVICGAHRYAPRHSSRSA